MESNRISLNQNSLLINKSKILLKNNCHTQEKHSIQARKSFNRNRQASVICNSLEIINPKPLAKVSSMFDLNSENMNKNTNDFKSSAGLNLTKQNRKSGTTTEFLHIKKIMDVEIKNEKLKCLINECPRFGPYYSKCQTCNNKNLVFFKDMKYENAEKLLRYFKKSGNT